MNKTILRYWPPFLIYFLICCFRSFQRVEGDIHIYLNAAKMYLNGENIYPYYLYPPPSILLFVPMTWLGDPIGRVIWVILNFLMFLRVLSLLMHFLESWLQNQFKKPLVLFIILACSMGMIDHNIQLGQMTITMLWVSFEFCFQVNGNSRFKAAVIMAFGITMKLLPGLFVFWLLVKRRYVILSATIFFLGFFALLPGSMNEEFTNQDLWKDWISTVNPLGERFGVETKNTVISLNGFLPAYFSEKFEGLLDPDYKPQRRHIFAMDSLTLEVILNILRFGLLILLLRLYSKSTNQFNFSEIAITLLVCILIFPHQMKYSMLLFVPAMILITLNFLKNYRSSHRSRYFMLDVILVLLFLLFALYGRDTIGDALVNHLDYYKYFSWLVIFSLMRLLMEASAFNSFTNEK